MKRRGFLKGLLSLAAVGAVGARSGEAFGKTRREDKTNVDRLTYDPDSEFNQLLDKLRAERNDPNADLEAVSDYVGFEVDRVSVEMRNTVSTERVRLAYGKNGEFVWLWSIQPGGKVPFKHRHDSEEIIYIKKGKIKCWLEGDKIVESEAGADEFVIPPHTDHQPFLDPDAKEPFEGVVHFDDEATAARVTGLYWRMVDAGYHDKKGKPDFRLMLSGTALETDRTYLTKLPQVLQDVARETVAFYQDPNRLNPIADGLTGDF